MKITSIQTKNFIGARDVDAQLTKPICLVAGNNGSGKSSLAEAVRMALTGESVRVSLKKDYGALIADGQESGFVGVLGTDGGQEWTTSMVLPSGKGQHSTDSTLPYVLDAQRFSSLDANTRRQFLFALMGLRTDGAAVKDRLTTRGCDAGKIDKISPHLRAGFDAAHKEAQANARESKAAWRAITGETYGSIKAAKWLAPKPAYDGNRLRQVREVLAHVTAQIEQGASELAVMQSAASRQAQQSERIASLRERAKSYARIAAKLQKDEADLKEWIGKVEHEARTGGAQMPKEPTYTCPACSAILRHDHANGALVEFTPPPVVYPTEPGKLAEYQAARDLLARSVENDKRDLSAADVAAKALAEVEGSMGDPAPAPEEIEAKRQKVSEARKEQARISEIVKTLEEDERTADRADEKTDAARSHHAEAGQWEAIADALAPGGIPGEMLSEALGPINDRLEQSSESAEWPHIHIEPDMGIWAAYPQQAVRPYSLLSESERWRADAMIAEAVSFLSGVRLLVLDRVDVLDLAGREDLLFWLNDLAECGEIETCLLFATLKAIPAGLPETVAAIWIENGVAGKVMEAA